MKKIIAFMFGYPLVWIKCDDQEIMLRFVRKMAGEYRACAIFHDHSVILNPGGSTSGKSYVKSWTPANKKAERLFKNS